MSATLAIMFGMNTKGASRNTSPPLSRGKAKGTISAAMFCPAVSFASCLCDLSLASETLNTFNHLKELVGCYSFVIQWGMLFSYRLSVRSLFQEMERLALMASAWFEGISSGRPASASNSCLLALGKALTSSTRSTARAPLTSLMVCALLWMVFELASSVGTLMLVTCTRRSGYKVCCVHVMCMMNNYLNYLSPGWDLDDRIIPTLCSEATKKVFCYTFLHGKSRG